MYFHYLKYTSFIQYELHRTRNCVCKDVRKKWGEWSSVVGCKRIYTTNLFRFLPILYFFFASHCCFFSLFPWLHLFYSELVHCRLAGFVVHFFSCLCKWIFHSFVDNTRTQFMENLLMRVTSIYKTIVECKLFCCQKLHNNTKCEQRAKREKREKRKTMMKKCKEKNKNSLKQTPYRKEVKLHNFILQFNWIKMRRERRASNFTLLCYFDQAKTIFKRRDNYVRWILMMNSYIFIT